jgi:hypothetical protein
MILTITAFILFTFQQPKPGTVALVFGPDPVRIEIIKTSEAEVLYVELQQKQIRFGLNAEEKKSLAAVNQALGTIPTIRVDPVHPAWLP